jgi:hypothetical protein
VNETTPHERLRQAVELSDLPGSFDQKKEALHDYMRAQGVRGVHSTRYTIQRWLTGRGNPPVYWLEMAAEFLKVNPLWLAEGVGRMHGKGTVDKPAPRPPQPRVYSEPQTPPVQGDKLEGDPPSEISIPSKEDVVGTNAATIMKFLEGVDNLAQVAAILEHEPAHPKYPGGRKTVIEAAKARMAELQAE